MRGKLGLKGALAVVVAMLAVSIGAAPASAEFGMESFDVTFENEDGTPVTQAGAHPFAQTTLFDINSLDAPLGGKLLDEAVKDLFVTQPDGFIGKPTAMPTCSTVDFLTPKEGEGTGPSCPDTSAIGVTGIKLANKFVPGLYFYSAVYNLEPPPGVPAEFGFYVRFGAVPVLVELGVQETPPYDVVAETRDPSQVLEFIGAGLTLWGNPAGPAHDSLRGDSCISLFNFANFFEYEPASTGSCPIKIAEEAFLTLPRACRGPLATHWEMDSMPQPGKFLSGSVLTHDEAKPPNPQGFTGCGKLGYAPEFEAKPSNLSESAESGTGLEFNLDFDDEGLTNPEGLAGSDTKKTVVTLPEGMTINPSVAEGLATCTPAELNRETLSSQPGEGCPNASKLGTLETDIPLVDEPLKGSIFLAQQDDPATAQPGAENPFDSLVALYFVMRNTNLGTIVKLPVKVEPDPKTGQLVATLDNIPQYPIAHFNATLREGQRPPLITPPTCGTYTTKTKFYPWAEPNNPHTVNSSFEVSRGVNGGPCPPGGLPPFKPGFEAGSLNNNAKSFSPFNMRLTRADGEQDMTKFSSVLPPGVLGSLAGLSKCPDSAIDVAKAKSGRQEQANPSCPANSQIGRSLAGAGVGGALTYVPGNIYLGGPYHGDPLSVISITPGVAGPFDAGTVVVRLALTLNPETAEVEVDGANSDPIPHILKGIVLKVRDLRVYVDRPHFILNPTSCDPSSAKATLFGSFLNVFDPADDVPVDLSSRYQAANCLNLPFKPKLSLQLKGGTRRGDHPALHAVLNGRETDANIGGAVVTLPKSAFLDQAHIRTICTRVQFAAKACPPGAQYGYARAWTPLLDDPIEGPVYLRSSNHKLPDLVAALHGLVDVNVVGRIDSYKGGIRSSFETVPDAPVTKFVLNMQGSKKGLIVNSRNLCAGKNRADALFTGQNGTPYHFRPVLKVGCGGKRKR